LIWWRIGSLALFLGLGGILGCYSEELDESTRKVQRMTEIYDAEEKVLGGPLKIDQIDFPGAGGAAGGGSMYKLKVFLRGPRGIQSTPGNPKAPKMPGSGAFGKGYEMEIMAALTNGATPVMQNSNDPPYGLVFSLDAKESKVINKTPRVETVAVLFRRDGEGDKKFSRPKLVQDLARFGIIPKAFDPDGADKDKHFAPKKIEPAFKEYMEGFSKSILTEEVIADSARNLPDGRTQVWFTYLVPASQKVAPTPFNGSMAVAYKVTWMSKKNADALGTGKGKDAKAKASGKEAEVQFDTAKKMFIAPEAVKRSLASLRLGPDVEKTKELFSRRSTGSSSEGGSGGGQGSDAKSK